MNRKLILVMVAVVATVLPAVAVADVLVVGYSGGTGVSTPSLFYIQPGSNYMAAQELTGFTYVSNKASTTEYVGNISDLGIMNNETIYEVNVLDINFTKAVTSGTFNISIDVSTVFPAGSAIFFNETAWTLTSLQNTQSSLPLADAYESTSDTYGYLPLSSPGTTTTLTFNDVSSTTTIYVAFVVGSGSVSSPPPSFTMTMDLTVS